MKIIVRICSLSILIAVCTLMMQAGPMAAYSNPTGVGNMSYGIPLGMDFQVNSPTGINVYSVGAFDSGQDGFTNRLTLSFYDLSNVASPVFSTIIPAGTGGTLVGGDRFFNLATPLFLASGTYSIVAQGFSSNDPYGNTLSTQTYGALNTNGGLISFVGMSRWSWSNGFPTILDRNAAEYGAGTFTFDAKVSSQDVPSVPEPGSMALMGGGLLLVGVWSRRFSR